MACPVDTIFVLDESGSIRPSNFGLMKSFLSRLVSRLDIDSGNTRVGIVTFSSDIGTGINLNAHSSVASLQSAISAVNYTGGGTNTAAALAYVRTTMLTSAAGDRSNIPNVVVVLTDGASKNSTVTQMESDQLKNMTANGIPTKVVALAIGSEVYLAELKNITSAPVERNIILVPNFRSIHEVEEQVRKASCTPSLQMSPTDSPPVVIIVIAVLLGVAVVIIIALVCRLRLRKNSVKEAKVQRITNAEIGPVSKVAEDEEYDEVISLYDFIDEQAVRGYEGLEQSTLAAFQQPSDYAGLAEAQTADTSDSTEHVDDADNNDQDQMDQDSREGKEHKYYEFTDEDRSPSDQVPGSRGEGLMEMVDKHVYLDIIPDLESESQSQTESNVVHGSACGSVVLEEHSQDPSQL